MKIRILIVDDQRLILDGLKLLLQSRLEFEVVGEASEGMAAVEMARTLRPDLVLMDIDMPLMNGVEAARRIIGDNRSTRIIALTMYAEPAMVHSMLRAGASGYVLKQYAFDELFRAIKTVASGQMYLCPAIASILVTTLQKNGVGEIEVSPLSPREREVLQLIAEGQSLKEIASLLCLSIKTIETHRKKIMNKLGLHSVAGLTKYAIQNGVTSARIAPVG